jgi:hypothetical protein
MTAPLVRDRPVTPPPSADDPAIDIPPNWRWDLAHWPHERWSRWRRYVGEFLESLDEHADVEDIRTAERAAYELIA